MRNVAILLLTMSLLISGCTKMTANKLEELASDIPDFDALASEMDVANQAISKEETEQATTQQPTTEQATTQQPTTEQVTTQQPATEQVTTQQPTTEQATTQQPATEQVTTQQPATEQVTTQQPATEQPTTKPEPAVSADNGVLKTFSVMSLDGNTYTQDVFTKADVNVVIFWTTWCGYCKMEMPVLEKLHSELKGQSIQFFNVCLNAEGEYYQSQAQTLIEEMGITYPSLIYNDSMSDGYVSEITGYPRTVYLNRKGEIMFEIGGAYAGYGEDYALGIHRDYAEYCLTYPDYLPAE